MGKAKVVWDRTIRMSDKYRVELKVYEVKPSYRYPEGFKARYVLVDEIIRAPRLIVDNHEPFGFHIHTALPDDTNRRLGLNIKDFREALIVFWRLTEEILRHENEKT